MFEYAEIVNPEIAEFSTQHIIEVLIEHHLADNRVELPGTREVFGTAQQPSEVFFSSMRWFDADIEDSERLLRFV